MSLGTDTRARGRFIHRAAGTFEFLVPRGGEMETDWDLDFGFRSWISSGQRIAPPAGTG